MLYQYLIFMNLKNGLFPIQWGEYTEINFFLQDFDLNTAVPVVSVCTIV